jgi:putative transposase
LFIESKWLYNYILSSNNINNFNTKITTVPVKILDKFENRQLEQISAQMKQSIKSRLFTSLSTLKALKSKGHKVGQLKFKREIKCIPLKQHTQTFTILKNTNRIKIQGIKQNLRVNGLDQLPTNPKDYEIANANLINKAGNYYINITIYTKKEILNPINETIGIDFGCTNQLTLSNGEKIKYSVPVSKRLKLLDHNLARKEKNSKNKQKYLIKREKEYLNLVNKRKEIKNQLVNNLVKNYKIICFQDESISDWKQNGHGKSIQNSAIGGIISAINRKAVIPIVINRYYPSTQICSNCGNRQKLKINERTYRCNSCGTSLDRDINSAINILNEGIEINRVPRESREFKPVETRTSSTFLKTKMSKVQSEKQETPTPLG